ncbi:MAG TPA: tetratricopeptide repeat protein [Blastocatellia bacterium]
MSLNKSKALRTAEKYVLQGKLPAAIDEYRKVVDADPSDLTTINTLGDLYVRAGKIQDAIRNFSRIADSYREGGFTLKAIAMLKKISKLDPTNVDTAMKLANLYSQQGLLVEARQQYLQVADAYARAGQTRKALEAYQKIADLDPSNTSVRMKLGEIYSREAMTEQAHESFIMAGVEFLRKGDTEQALNANLKAITVNPDSRQALTAIATIYTQHGQIDRAINILCEAFERNPGDVELLTILGRTYLSAGMMDDAERTFLSLVELDRNRYHYLLEVGRRFLQIGDLDRAAEQIDGCLDVLIAKREEDKAIDFLRKVLDRDMNHVGSLKRLAQIFMRIREDHNLIATLNSLVEAAMRKGDDKEAIVALKELARLEPDESMHLQRLYNLGVKDIVELDSPDVVRATGPLDFEAAAFDDAFVIRQISEAEILAGHGQVSHAVEILTEILNHAPENVQVHLKLKDIYLRAGVMDKAAAECYDLARIHEARGESARASDYIAEARQINPLIEAYTAAHPNHSSLRWTGETSDALGIGAVRGKSNGDPGKNGDSGFEVQEGSNTLDWNKYQTGTLTDQPGFVTVPEDRATANRATGVKVSPDHSPMGGAGFRYSDTLVGDSGEARGNGNQVADLVFSSTGNLPSDTMSRVLRDELEGIDFYIAQGYVEIARDTLDRVREENGDHPEIISRYKRLGVSFDSDEMAAAVKEKPAAPSEDRSFKPVSTVFLQDLPEFVDENATELPQDLELMMNEVDAQASVELPVEQPGEMPVADSWASQDEGPEKDAPFLIHKESGPLYRDLMVQLNTGDLLKDTEFASSMRSSDSHAPTVGNAIGTGDLIDSIVSNIDSSFDIIQRPSDSLTAAAISENVEPVSTDGAEPAAASFDEAYVAQGLSQGEDSGAAFDAAESIEEVEGAIAPEARSIWKPDSLLAEPVGDELQDIFEELKENTGGLKPLDDFETHYSLGLAYKDMDLLDDAISEVQMAFRTAGMEDLKGDYIHCCNMLGVCFRRKQMPKVAVMWFQRGLRVPARSEDEYQALKYEIGLCYEEMGEFDKAIDVLTEVYGTDVNYRQVAQKLKQLQSAKNEC